MPYSYIRDMAERTYFGIKYKTPTVDDLRLHRLSPLPVSEVASLHHTALFGGVVIIMSDNERQAKVTLKNQIFACPPARRANLIVWRLSFKLKAKVMPSELLSSHLPTAIVAHLRHPELLMYLHTLKTSSHQSLHPVRLLHSFRATALISCPQL